MENKDVAKNENKDAPFSYLNLQKFNELKIYSKMVFRCCNR